MHRKIPFAPESKTTPSMRNPALERALRDSQVSVQVTEAAVRPAASHTRLAAARDDDDDLVEYLGPGAERATPTPRIPPAARPRIVVDLAFIRALPLGPRDGFLLAHVDGASDLRTLVDVSGMTELEVTDIIERLLELGVVEV